MMLVCVVIMAVIVAVIMTVIVLHQFLNSALPQIVLMEMKRAQQEEHHRQANHQPQHTQIQRRFDRRLRKSAPPHAVIDAAARRQASIRPPG